MKTLRIGDPHVKPGNLEEAGRIMEMALSLAQAHDVDRIEILGDQMHTHAIIRLEVLEFWNRWMPRFTDYGTIVLVGNHDMSGDHGSTDHSLKVFKYSADMPLIVDSPTTVGIYGYLPYYHNPEHFVTSARHLATNEGAKVLICHQTLGGAQYENGFYAPDAIDPGLLPYDLIISGHIHKRQIIEANGKTIIYPGTAKWDTLSDANEPKGLTIYTHDDVTGKILSTEFFSTHKICKPIMSIVIKQGELSPEISDFNSVRLNVELVGTSDWIKEQREKFRGIASVRAKITDSRQVRMENGTSLEEFISKVYQTDMDKEVLLDYMIGEGLVHRE